MDNNLQSGNEGPSLILPVLLQGTNLVTDEEFYKTLAEKIIVTLRKDPEKCKSWVSQGTPIYIRGIDNEPDTAFPMVKVGNICAPDAIPQEFRQGKNIQEAQFASTESYTPSAMHMPILSLVVNSALRHERGRVVVEIIRAVIITFDHMNKEQLVPWQENQFRTEVFFNDTLVGGENLFMTMNDVDVPGGVVLLAHWIS